MNIVVLDANQPADRFYRGGAAIDAFRGTEVGPDRRPEDWVGSTTTLHGDPNLGLSHLPDGGALRSVILEDPVAWLGPDHVARFGPLPQLLVKLLDAGQRLPVHAHPDDAFAAEALQLACGKAEAWYILRGGQVHLGLREAVSKDQLASLIHTQDVEVLLGLLHIRTVDPGQLVFVPPGVLHAIGEGILVLEIQQPQDLSILLEWRDFALDGAVQGHLGLGFDRALDAVEREPRDADDLITTFADASTPMPNGAADFFRLERHLLRTDDDEVTTGPGFGVVVVAAGWVTITPERGRPIELSAGVTAVAPFAAGRLALHGDGDLLIARPPVG